ncbi:hypothetical protein D9756_001322 [Leucocoprinus leucothites]|uniref:Uncharacterized protein n=1 Tax=Leucocoprinus leucothites TaxID=201217 RepID=A0A8H5G3Q6_9AGAR|nr:hypothetical protein D9756_001322 [Leucoagaricus leucothites]
MTMSTLARILPRIPATRRPYSSFGGGRFFNSSKPPKSPVVTAKSKNDRSGSIPKDSSAKASAAKAAQGNNTPSTTPNSTKPPAPDAASSEPGHEPASGRQSLRNGGAVSTSSSSPSSPPTASAYLSGYSAPNAYHNYLSPHPTVNSKDFKIHQFFSLHRPLLLISNPPSIFESPPADTPLFRSLTSLSSEVKNEDRLPPSPFTSLNLDGTYGGAVSGVDGDAEAARQLHHTMTMSRIGATVGWEETLKALGIDVSKDAERVMLQEQWDKEWEEVMMDSTKRKKKKKMKKHK